MDDKTWRRKQRPVHWGGEAGEMLLFKDENPERPWKSQRHVQVEVRQGHHRPLPPMAASDLLSPRGRREARALSLRDTQRPGDKPG